MIQQLQQIFHSVIKSLEVWHVIEGAKPCARILVFEDYLEKIIDFLTQNQLFFVLSDFKVLKQRTQSEFYSDKSITIQKNAPENGYFFVYISKTKNFAEKAKFLEENNNHLELGLILGYPKCCCDFFKKNFNEKNADLTLRILNNSQGYEFPFYNNIAARHFDVSLLSHFPHSFSCEPSIKIAKENLRIIRKKFHPLDEIFFKCLNSTVIYSISEGIFLLRKNEKSGSKIIYGDVLSTTKSKLYYLLSSNKELEIIDKNNIIVGGEKIGGAGFGVMIFN